MVDRQSIIDLGSRLVRQELGSQWHFQLDRARTRLGACHYDRRAISLSGHLLDRIDLSMARQAILHEIAHALAGRTAGHGPKWRVAARQLGYTGGRTIKMEQAWSDARWLASCRHGHQVLRHRRPRQATYCGRCAQQGSRQKLAWQDRRLVGLSAALSAPDRSDQAVSPSGQNQ
ncbi:MAG: SprT-like domain-containing protein [Propionibacteriaceae bacterium]|jgi:predicted SprT family Zn-dependent metalloprotease|nr:SprT-like domain-containing protein [Propionibacteriaceae bacterium]